MSTIPTPSLVAQAKAILQAATSLEQQLDAHGLPQPSFAASGRKDWQDAVDHPGILQARSSLIDASHQMRNLALGPTEMLFSLAGPAISQIDVFRTLDALGVPQAVPSADRASVGVAELAATLGVSAKLLHQQLRFAYLMGLFYEPRDGFVAHTAASAAMPVFSPWTQMRLDRLMSWGAWELPEALRRSASNDDEDNDSGKARVPPVSLGDPKGRSFWKALEEDDPEGKGMEKFSSSMKALLAGHTGNSFVPFVRGFDWSSLGEGLVIDVGGGNAHVEVRILDDVPAGINFLIQDLGSNEKAANEAIKEHGVEQRVEFQVHDFFRAQPPELKPKAYILSRILHDWQDEDCMRILRGLTPAMAEHGTKLFVYERVLPNRIGDIPNHMEQLMRTQDLLMFTLFGGGERSLKDWDALFKKADPRLTIAAIRHSQLSPFSNMEIVWA